MENDHLRPHPIICYIPVGKKKALGVAIDALAEFVAGDVGLTGQLILTKTCKSFFQKASPCEKMLTWFCLWLGWLVVKTCLLTSAVKKIVLVLTPVFCQDVAGYSFFSNERYCLIV